MPQDHRGAKTPPPPPPERPALPHPIVTFTVRESWKPPRGFRLHAGGGADGQEVDFVIVEVRQDFSAPDSWGEVARRRLSCREGRAFLERLAWIGLRACPPDVCGVDGTTCEFRIERGFNELALKWWDRLPDAWWPLLEAIRFLAPELGAQLETEWLARAGEEE